MAATERPPTICPFVVVIVCWLRQSQQILRPVVCSILVYVMNVPSKRNRTVICSVNQAAQFSDAMTPIDFHSDVPAAGVQVSGSAAGSLPDVAPAAAG